MQMFGFSRGEEVGVTLGAEAGDDVEMDHALCSPKEVI